MRIGVDVGGTNTDAVLMDGRDVLAWTKQPTSADVEGGIAAAIGAVLADGGIAPGKVASVTIGTTHFVNALVERRSLSRVGVIRLASPSGEALEPFTGWPRDLVEDVKGSVYLLPGGYEVDGREIAPLDEEAVRAAARDLAAKGIRAVAIISAFATVNPAMEQRAAALVQEEYSDASITVSSAIGRIGIIERENAAILNAALSQLAAHTIAAFENAVKVAGIAAPLFISQNDGTLIGAPQAMAYPVMTMGSGPTNSMRGAAFLSGIADAMVLDVGGTTTDIGVLSGGYPRESALAVDIGGTRTNFRMPDILAIGLGGGSRVRLDAGLHAAADLAEGSFAIGPDSVGYRLAQKAVLFGGDTLTASDVAVAAGLADFGDKALLPKLSPRALTALTGRMRAIVEDGIDRMKTARGDVRVLAVGGGAFLVPETLRGVSQVIRPPHAAVANAVGAAIAQVGAQIEQVVDYEVEPREAALARISAAAAGRVREGGGRPDAVDIVDIDETYLSYLPGRAVQVRVRAVADLAPSVPETNPRSAKGADCAA